MLSSIIIPTVHLASFFHTILSSRHGDARGLKPITDAIRMDYLKAYKVSQEGVTHQEHLICLLPNGPVDFMEYYTLAVDWMKYWLLAKPPLAIDVESTSLEYAKCNLHSIAIAEGAPNNIAVSFPLIDLRLLPESLEQELLGLLRQILADLEITKVFHNASYDTAVLDRKGLHVHGPIQDTMGLHHIVQPDIPHDLGFVGHTYLQVGPWKLEYRSNEGYGVKIKDYWKLLIYNAKDALYTAQLVPELVDHIHQRGMTDELIFWQNSYAELSREMERWGLPVNLRLRRHISQLKLRKILQLQRDMREYLNWPDFNPMSLDHKAKALYSGHYSQSPWKLGLIPTATTKKRGDPSTGYKAIIDHIEHPFVAMLVMYVEERQAYGIQFRDEPDVEIAKIKDLGATTSDFAGGLPGDTDEDMHCAQGESDEEGDGQGGDPIGSEDISQEIRRVMKSKKCGAFRAAIVGDIHGDRANLFPRWKPYDQKGIRQTSSPNVANIREKAKKGEQYSDREIFEAPPGWTFCGGDKDQVELREIAARSGCKALLDVLSGRTPPESYFSDKIDPHTFATVNIFTPEWWQSHDREEREDVRKICKNVEFCGFYLGGPEKVWRTSRENKRVDMELRRKMTLPLVRDIHTKLFHGLFHEIYEWHEANIEGVKRDGYFEIPPFGRRRYSPVMPPPVTEFSNWGIQTACAERITSEICKIMWDLRKFKGEAGVVVHLHDQVGILCKQEHVEEVKKIYLHHFGNTEIESPYGPVYLSAGFSVGPTLYHTK